VQLIKAWATSGPWATWGPPSTLMWPLMWILWRQKISLLINKHEKQRGVSKISKSWMTPFMNDPFVFYELLKLRKFALDDFLPYFLNISNNQLSIPLIFYRKLFHVRVFCFSVLTVCFGIFVVKRNFRKSCCRAFHGFGQAKFTDSGSALGTSQFSILPQLHQKTMFTSKGVKIGKKISNSSH